jgi:hypothetical protein
VVAAAVEAHPHDLPRLGESVEFGALLLELCELSGWLVFRGDLIGNGGGWVEAWKGSLHVRGELPLDVFLSCMRLDGRYMGAL